MSDNIPFEIQMEIIKKVSNVKSLIQFRVIDKGEGSYADGHRRREVVRLIQKMEKVDAMEVAQKAKIKWSIEEKRNKSCVLLERDFVKKFSSEQNDDLEREVSKEEIKKAVWHCGIDKAPGPNGFTFGFYRRY
nr:RNA-directed DNA polymerase, eukaryota, reverse transcriptase zinc-binding domain protein [Tanacetum cinerariifolium]